MSRPMEDYIITQEPKHQHRQTFVVSVMVVWAETKAEALRVYERKRPFSAGDLRYYKRPKVERLVRSQEYRL